MEVSYKLILLVGLVGVVSVEASSADMVTARSVKCLTAESILVFLFLGTVVGVAVGVVLLEALETLLIRSVLPVPDSLKYEKFNIRFVL